MKLSELLDHLAVHVLDDRAEMLNGSPDELWSDELLVRWLNEAQRILCRDAWVLEDVGHAQAGTIQLVQNQKDYPLHKSVVRVLSGRLSDTEIDLARGPYDLSRPQATINAYDLAFSETSYSDAPGRPQVLSTDVTFTSLRVRPAPDAAAAALTLVLRVSRMPYAELAVDSPEAEPEVPYQHHLDLVEFAGGKALTIPAADAQLRSLGRDMLEIFDERVAKAKKERQRREMAPGYFRFGGWARG